MALRATKDTYGVENIGGAEVRRLVKAGSIVPPSYTVPDSDVEQVDTAKQTAANRAAGVQSTFGTDLTAAEQAEAADKEQAENLEALRKQQADVASGESARQAQAARSGKSSSKKGD